MEREPQMSNFLPGVTSRSFVDNKLKHEYIEMRLISVPNLHGNDFIHQFIAWQIPACSTSTSDFALLEHKHALGQITLR
jgi:hypothetical protein